MRDEPPATRSASLACGGSGICDYSSARTWEHGVVTCNVPTWMDGDNLNCIGGFSATLTPDLSTYRLDDNTPHGFFLVEVPYDKNTYSCCSTPFCMDLDRSVDNGYFGC
ncbi:uncharacterized protein BJX67DRAFT_379616 [Aspergillus lucknowensis]|uniref:Uncharacterized protein n=1 Tax=Aspergillus lucknowensis TaxID=176173 RepID=A0ABR4LX71_9EURO